MPNPEPVLILASSSPWRAQLLRQLGVHFDATAPEIDETPRADEPPRMLAERLARTKAQTVADAWPAAIVIGADQVADVNGRVLGKPGTVARAKAQLRIQSGQRVVFNTGLCVCAPSFDMPQVAVETVITQFRELDDAEIERYVTTEDVTRTAGSLKAEGLGITLVESIESRDPTALIGLPLITLRRFLAAADLVLP